MIDFLGLAASAIPAAIEGMRFVRCDQCRTRDVCESARLCGIADGEHKPSAAFIDYPHDWRRDAQEMGK